MNTTGIHPGDIIEIDGPSAKGSDGLAASVTRYHALVVDNDGQVLARRFAGGRSFRVRSRLIIGHWRATAATRKRREGESP